VCVYKWCKCVSARSWKRILLHTYTGRKNRRRHYGASQSLCRCRRFFILGWNWRGGVGGGVVGGRPPALSHPLSRVRAKVVRIRNFRFVLLWSLLSGQMLPRIGESTPKWGWKRVKWGKGGRVKSVEVDANKVAFCCCFGVCCLIRLVNDSQWAHWLA